MYLFSIDFICSMIIYGLIVKPLATFQWLSFEPDPQTRLSVLTSQAICCVFSVF